MASIDDGRLYTAIKLGIRGTGMGGWPDAALAQAITNGKPATSMAPWRGVLSPEDVRRVILFIRRTLQRSP